MREARTLAPPLSLERFCRLLPWRPHYRLAASSLPKILQNRTLTSLAELLKFLPLEKHNTVSLVVFAHLSWALETKCPCLPHQKFALKVF